MTATAFPPTGYTFRLTCPDDGGPMHMGDGYLYDEDHTAAVATCKACGQGFDVDVRLLRRPKKRSRIARVSARIDAAAESATAANLNHLGAP